MKESLLEYLRCPLTQNRLSLTIIKSVGIDGSSIEIEEGYLTSVEGYIFPVVKGVPRLLLESFIDHQKFLRRHLSNYDLLYKQIMDRYGNLIKAAIKRNKSTKNSFSFECSLLKQKEKTNIWYLDAVAFRKQLFKELSLSLDYYSGKIAVDAGCGHGRSSRILAEKCAVCIGADLGNSIEKAHAENDLPNCFFIQADLHHLPFAPHSFDIVYCSGVVHHTPDTRKAFVSISQFVKKKSILCIWLYHSIDKRVHRFMLKLRKITIHLPLRFQFWMYLILFVPAHKVISWLKGKPKSWREILITHLDMLSPKYRHEHSSMEVKKWFEENGYSKIEVTTTDNYGFSIKGIKEG